MYRESIVTGRKPQDSNNTSKLFGPEGKNKHSIRTEGRNKNSKNEERLRNLQDNFKHFNIRIIGVPGEQEEQQEIKNLLENIMKENFPNLEKEIDFQEFQEAQRVPKKLDPRSSTPRHIHHYYITQD